MNYVLGHPMTKAKLRMLSKAVKLFLTKGVENVSVKTIVKANGVSSQSFYYYFKSKEELLRDAFDFLREVLYGGGNSGIDFGEHTSAPTPLEVSRAWLPLFEDGRSHAIARKILLLAIREQRYNKDAAKIVLEIHNTITERIVRSLEDMSARGVIEPIDAEAFALVYVQSFCLSAKWDFQRQHDALVTMCLRPREKSGALSS